MKTSGYQANLSVNTSAAEVFRSINDVATWWTKNLEGNSRQLDDVFTVRFGETFITLKIVELVPDEKISWQVLDCHKHWLRDPKEWKGTRIDWEISTNATGTHIGFSHVGLVPSLECFDACSNAWGQYLQELVALTSGVEKRAHK